MVDAYDNFLTAVEAMNGAASIKTFCEDAIYKKHYSAIRRYLNIHELISVGIKTKMLDEKICYEYWGTVMIEAYEDCRQLITYLQKDEGEIYSYIDLVSRAQIWQVMDKKLAKLAGKK